MPIILPGSLEARLSLTDMRPALGRKRCPTLFAPLVALLFLSALPAQAERNLVRPPGTTRYAPMVARLKALLAYDQTQGAHRMALSSIGQSVKGRDIWMVTLHEAAPTPASPPSRRPEGTSASGRGASHGRLCLWTRCTAEATGPSPILMGEGWPKAGEGGRSKKTPLPVPPARARAGQHGGRAGIY